MQYSFNIAFPIEDFPTQLTVRQNAVVAIVLQGATTDLQRMADILIVHPIVHTPATTLAVDTIHSLNELPMARYKLPKGLFLNADNHHNYFILH